ncbi:MAG: tryptophan 2,3-dioxygenase family protein [Pseudomonadales bacterium]|jgi:tryptophan 2,3-dioxygenase|nr:tryptophan 2,3-dioxygenase family protein [Pseudomonadales bacterium]
MDPSENHYWSYHGLETLLACKQPVTASQDEDLFIAVHQVCEIALHQMVLDLSRALDAYRAVLDATPGVPADCEEIVYFLRRVNRLWKTVNTTMPILADMRAFGEFRDAIGPTSGFQSFQFRHLEIMSGVPRYWTGGTADETGTPHVAETEFDRRYGADVEAWLATHRAHSLRHHTMRLLERADAAALRAQVGTRALVAELAAYDRAQRRFHLGHLQLATVQLERVGVETGTGGTSFRDYLASYEREVAPLFPALAEPLEGGAAS